MTVPILAVFIWHNFDILLKLSLCLYTLLWYIKFVSNIMSIWYHYSLVSKVCQIHFLWIHLFYTALIYQIGVKYCVQMIYHTCVKSMLNYFDGWSRSTNILYIKFVSYVTPLFPCVKSMSNPYPIYACSSCFDISNLCQTCLPNATLCQKYVKSSPRKIVTRYIKFVSNVESWLTLFLCVKSMSIFFFAKIITLRLCQKYVQIHSLKNVYSTLLWYIKFVSNLVPRSLPLCQKYVKSIWWIFLFRHFFDISNLFQILIPLFSCVKSMSYPWKKTWIHVWHNFDT